MPERGFDMHVLSADEALSSNETRLVDLIDGLLDCGVVLRGELWLSVAEVDLVFLGVDLVLANPNTMKQTQQEPAGCA
jgi:hypothetical protein